MLGKIMENFGKMIPAELSKFSYYRSTSDKWSPFSTASLANLARRPFEAFSRIFSSSSCKPCKVDSNRHSSSNFSRMPFFKTAISALLNLHDHKLELAHKRTSMVFELQQFNYLFLQTSPQTQSCWFLHQISGLSQLSTESSALFCRYYQIW